MKNKITKIIVGLLAIVGLTFGGSQLGGGRQFTPVMTVLDDVVTTTVGTVFYAKDFRNAVYSLDTSGSTIATVKFVGSIQDDCGALDFEAPQSSSNQYDYIEVVDLEDETSIDGDTGVSLTGTDDNRMFELNINMLSCIAPVVTSWTAGTIKMQGSMTDNQ